MRGISVSMAWWAVHWAVPDVPPSVQDPSWTTSPLQTQQPQHNQQHVQQLQSSFTPPSALSQGASQWLASETTASPTQGDVALLQEAFATFYNPKGRDLVQSEQLLSKAIGAWQSQPEDERAGLYRVRGDCYSAMGDANKAVEDYTEAIRLLESPGGAAADPSELPAAVLGRARALKGLQQDITVQKAQQSASDYERYLKLNSREEWDTDQELIEDGATRNPYAAWEWGSVLRKAQAWSKAAEAHTLAAQAFTEIGDKPRSVISFIDAGIDYAAAKDVVQATELLSKIIPKTIGVEARDVALLQRVVAKEGEGRMALAALYWSNPEQRPQAETVLGDACVRLEQLQADAAARKNKAPTGPVDPFSSPDRLRFSIDEDVPALQVSCSRFKNPVFLDQLGWPKDLQDKVIKLETLR